MRTLAKKKGNDNYTFLDNGIEDIAPPSDDDNPNKHNLNLQKDIIKTRSLNL